MIVNKDINPKRDVYYLGAKTIEILSAEKNKVVDFFDVFQKLNASEHISINLFILTLDWLYLIGSIEELQKGKIVKCF